MKPTFEITICRRLEPDLYPVVAELNLGGAGDVPELPLRSEGRLRLSATDIEDLGAKTSPADYGTLLCKALFTGEILRAFDRAAADSGGSMRVLLSVEPLELRSLHWEWLCIPMDQGFRFIAQDQRFPYCLVQPSLTDRRFPALGRRDLRMLVVVASPSGLESYKLDPFDEARALQTVSETLRDEIPWDVLASSDQIPGRMDAPSLSALCEHLTKKRYTLLHIIAHGRLNRAGETILYLSNGSGGVATVSASEMIGRLAELAALPHFIFLAVCESARPEAEAVLGGLGQRLVRELGVPVVLAMTRKVSHFLAYELAKRLYPQLLEHGEVERALVQACAGLIGQDDVLVPALYSRLAGRPLFSDELEGHELTAAEVVFGLDRLLGLFAERAPALMPRLLGLVNQVRVQLGLVPRVLAQVESSRVAAGKERAEAPRAQTAGPLRAGNARPAEAPPGGYGAALSEVASREKQQTLAEIESLSLRVLDMSFAAVARNKPTPMTAGPCPFPGLLSFGIDHQIYFFGRDALIEGLLSRLKERPFLIVLGAAASGKSSLVRAGLLPRLVGENAALQVLTLVPGADPGTRLEAALVKAGLGRSPPPGSQALLFIDQFEELFTLCPRDKRTPFLRRLLELQQAIPVLLAMRSDYWSECASYPETLQLMQDHQALIPHLSGHELRSAIEQQARAGGLRFDPGLCERIIDEVQSEPGAMPLVQHVLRKLWERRHGPWLSAAEYESIGGIGQVLAETADDIYERLSPADQARMRAVFVRLACIDDDSVAREVRRRVPLSELIPAAAQTAPYEALITRLVAAHLLLTSNVSAEPPIELQQVEVIHEALIRSWRRLDGWLEEQRDSLALRESVRKAARTWLAQQRSRQWLVHTRGPLRESEALAVRFPGVFNGAEQEYLNACRTAGRLLRALVAMLMFVCLGSIGLSVGLTAAMRHQQLQEGDALRWAAGRQAGMLATLLALEPSGRLRPLDQGIRAVAPFYQQGKSPPAEALSGLRDGLRTAVFARPLIAAHDGEVTALALTADGAVLASAGIDRRLRIFDADSGAMLHSVFSGSAPATAVLFASDGSHLFVASCGGALQVYERSGALVSHLDDFGEAVTALTLDADGTRLAGASISGQVRLYGLAGGAKRLELVGARRGVLALAFTAEGPWLAGGGEDGTLLLWDTSAPQLLPYAVPAHGGSVPAVAALPGGTTVVSGGTDRLVRLWSADKGQPIGEPWAVDAPVSALSVGPQQTIAVGDREGGITVWSLPARALLWSARDEPQGLLRAAVSGLAFSPSVGRLAVAATDGKVRIWNAKATGIVRDLPELSAPVTAVDISPDHSLCLTAGDRSLRIYHVASGWPVSEIAPLDAPVVSAAFAPDDQVTVVTRAGTVTRYLAQTGARVLQQSLPVSELSAAHIDRTARRAVLAARSEVQVWDLLTGRLVNRFPQRLPVQAVAVAEDGKQIAAATADQGVRIYQPDSGALLHSLKAAGGSVRALRFSTDGRRLLSGGQAQPPRLWELAAERAIELPVSDPEQAAVAMAADGKRAIVGAARGEITIWDLESRQPILLLHSRHPLLRSATLSEDGSYVLVGDHDGAARLALIEPERLWKLGCETLAASIRAEDDTPDSWEQARAACRTTRVP